MVRLLVRAVALVLVSTFAFAADAPGKPEAVIRAKLAASMPNSEVTSVAPSPVPGLYEVVLDGAETAYVTADGQYLISGDLYQTMPGKGLANLTEQRQGGQRRNALAKADRSQFVTFRAKGKEKAFIYVFTDIDCGYCRKLHQEVPALNAAGVTVHYLAFPRAGLASETGRKMDAVWCAADRNKALTDAKRGTRVPPAPAICKSPVGEQYKLGIAMGVRGTPAVFEADGTQIGGYIPADEMVAHLLKTPAPAP